jgi:hypothetical protein
VVLLHNVVQMRRKINHHATHAVNYWSNLGRLEYHLQVQVCRPIVTLSGYGTCLGLFFDALLHAEHLVFLLFFIVLEALLGP